MNWPLFAVSSLFILRICGSFPASAQAGCGVGQVWDPEGRECVAAAAHAKFGWPAAGVVVMGCGRGEDARVGEISLALRPGSEIHAAQSGRVAYAGDGLKGFDEVIFIRHADEWVSAYALSGTLLIKTGDIVRRGQLIARTSQGDNLGQNRLRFGLRRHSVSLNPLGYLESVSDHPVSQSFCSN